VSRAKKAIVGPGDLTIDVAHARWIRARVVEDYAKQALAEIKEAQGMVEELFEGFAIHLEAHDDGPDVEEKSGFADLFFKLRQINRHVDSVVDYVSERAQECATAEAHAR
jgi:hypothetical protein